jgi:ribosome-binding ATPase YchF (GTP1/OBG family)
VKIGIFGIEGFTAGKEDIVDKRVDALKLMFNSAKKVFIQAEILVSEERLVEADVIACPEAGKLDLILKDMEFVETRLERSQNNEEKVMLGRFKEQLEKEKFLSELTLTPEERKLIEGATLLTMKPVLPATAEQIGDKKTLLFDAYYRSGYISFFTAGDKDAHAWPLKSGQTAWDAAGAIHSAIQQGFIRAEVIGYDDLIADGSLSKAKANNHMHLEMKDYVVKDGDYLVIRTNK